MLEYAPVIAGSQQAHVPLEPQTRLHVCQVVQTGASSGKIGSTFGAPGFDDFAARLRRHAGPKAVPPLTLQSARLKWSFHCTAPIASARESSFKHDSQKGLNANVTFRSLSIAAALFHRYGLDQTTVIHSHPLLILSNIAFRRTAGVEPTLWNRCLDRLEGEFSPQQFNTWIRPLHAIEDGNSLRLLAPNHFVRDWVNEHLINRLTEVLTRLQNDHVASVVVQIGSREFSGPEPITEQVAAATVVPARTGLGSASRGKHQNTGLRPDFTFDTFVEGKSNQLARAASIQVSENPGGAYNPLFIYGGVGLGKTHLVHAISNAIARSTPSAKVVYLHSERFVADMVNALQHNTINDFKRYYRSADALLIDDIQFFARKERSQEEFFHTFNTLLEGQQQVVLTCDRYPKEVEGLEERLKSRFGWGLPVAIEPPELETRAAILMRKASLSGVELENDVALFIAQRIRSNVRELEGALRRVIATSQFMGQPIDLHLAKEALRDLLALHDRMVTIENIQKTVAQYYKLRVADMVSKRRTRSIARPRQISMALAKELTNHSLPEIGDAFGGRDHTTVLHACRKVAELRENNATINEEYRVLLRSLSN